MSEHSELLEWLAEIPPLPWHSTGSVIVDTRGLTVLTVGSDKAELKLSQHQAVADYTAHCATYLPVLVKAADQFYRLMQREFPQEAKTETPCEVWDKLYDAIRDAKAMHPFPIEEECADKPEARALSHPSNSPSSRTGARTTDPRYARRRAVLREGRYRKRVGRSHRNKKFQVHPKGNIFMDSAWECSLNVFCWIIALSWRNTDKR